MSKPKTAWVFSGAGSGGAAQATMARREYGRSGPPHFMVGVSAGAVNAYGIYRNGVSSVIHHWEQTKDDSKILNKYFLPSLWRRDGFANNEPLGERFLADKTPHDWSKPDVLVGFTDFVTGKICYASANGYNGPSSFVRWLRASAAPSPMVDRIDGRFADGGHREIAPVREAIERGAEKVIVFLGTRPGEIGKYEGRGILSNLKRHIAIQMDEVLKGDLDFAQRCKAEVIVYAPKTPTLDWADYSSSTILQKLEEGETALEWKLT